MPRYHWFRTPDHPAANDRDVQAGEKQWNIDFESDRDPGITYRIHVGEKSREKLLAMLAEDAAKSCTEAELAEMRQNAISK